MLRLCDPRLCLAATLVAGFALLLILSPAVGAEERRDGREGSDEKTPTPVVLQVSTATPAVVEADPVEAPPVATSQDDDAVLVATTGDQETSPEGCEQAGWVPSEEPINPDLGCLPTTVVDPGAQGSEGDPATATLVLPPKPEEHPGHCPEGYSYELLLHQDELGNLTWLYACVWDGSLDPAGPNDIVAAEGGVAPGGEYTWTIEANVKHPDHGCPEGYVQELLLRQNADGSLTWLYGCVPDGSGPTGPVDEAGTGGDGNPGGSPRIVPTDGLTSVGGGTAGGGDKCPSGHTWTDGPLEFPNWPIDTDGDGTFDSTDTIVVDGGCVPDGGECPEGSAIHPFYTEYGCIPYGSGPWAT